MKKKLDIKEIGIEKLAVMFLCGVVLLILSWPQKEESKTETMNLAAEYTGENKEYGGEVVDSTEGYVKRMEERVEDILSQVDGVGKVQVMLTVKTSKEKVTLKDSPYAEDVVKEKDSTGGTRESKSITSEETTILIEDGSGDAPYVLMEIEPEIEGVLVLAENGNIASVKTEIIEAVQVLFHVPSHKIKVMKMQENQ